MPQLHLYVSEEIAAKVRQMADASGCSISRFLADLVLREVTIEWPEGYFSDVVGAWSGEPLERPPQGYPELRESLT